MRIPNLHLDETYKSICHYTNHISQDIQQLHPILDLSYNSNKSNEVPPEMPKGLSFILLLA